jgi:hypothetical protein
VLVYLMTHLGGPVEVVNRQHNLDNEGKSLFHILCYRGHFDCLVGVLNLERCYLKKILYDSLCKEKKQYRFKAMDIADGKLVGTVFHDQATVRKHEEFNIRVQSLFEDYSR